MTPTTGTSRPLTQPVDPTKKISYSSVYTLFYRKDTNHILTKNFHFEGSLNQAIERAQQHCTIIGARFNFVQPFISNLDLEESYLRGNYPKPGMPAGEKVETPTT